MTDVRFPDEFNLADYWLFAREREGRGDHPAIRFGDRTWTYAEVADAISVPARAVTTTGTTSTVTVRADGEDETRTVTTGLTTGTMVQITSGLAEGEEVVVAFPGRPTQGGGAGELPSGGIPGGAVTGGPGTGAGG